MKHCIILCTVVVTLLSSQITHAQWTYGTAGLLSMPSADMNENGTFVAGVSYLNKHASTSRWFYDTYGYYFDITFFSCFEFSYYMILHKGMYDDYGSKQTGYWAPWSYGKFCNQDRQMSLKLRLWKEGWVKDWTPQITVGSNDVTSNSWGRTGDRFAVEDDWSNGFNNRYFVAISKHFSINNLGVVGTHLSYLYNVRSDYSLNAPSFGANLQFGLSEGSRLNKYVNGLNLMLEAYPANGQGYIYDNSYSKQLGINRGAHCGIYDINIGAEYSLALLKKHPNSNSALRNNKDTSRVDGFFSMWNRMKNYLNDNNRHVANVSQVRKESLVTLNLYAELYGCKHPSFGCQLCVHLQ